MSPGFPRDGRHPSRNHRFCVEEGLLGRLVYTTGPSGFREEGLGGLEHLGLTCYFLNIMMMEKKEEDGKYLPLSLVK